LPSNFFFAKRAYVKKGRLKSVVRALLVPSIKRPMPFSSRLMITSKGKNTKKIEEPIDLK